jgi:hypothetical protein
MKLNSGLFVYTLDDPYIHFSLAQHIMHGHYGINNIEFSAPSSTILWPFILAPFSNYPIFALLINILSAIATLYIFTKIFQLSFDLKDKQNKNILITSLLILLIFVTNMIGLIFTGMEHSLQVFAVCLIVYGLIIEIKINKIKFWFIIAIIAAPLIRYENLAVSLAAIGYLLLNGHIKKGISAAIFILVSAGGFSLFLISLNLYPFPTSIFVKSDFIGSGGSYNSILSNLSRSLTNREGIILEFGAAVLFVYFLITQNRRLKILAFVSLFALIMHFLFGRYGWFNRYEIYILTYFMLIIIYLLSEKITSFIEDKDSTKRLIKILISASATLVLIGQIYIESLTDIPIASNNIYEQQYQMRRFAADYYKKNVAVNDLGYVSYKNENYVLDLFGLASIESFNDRNSENTSDWMQRLIEEKHVGLAMIYEAWFQYLPDTWIKVGELYLGSKKITPAYPNVAFYATNRDEYPEIVSELGLFIRTLPRGVQFFFQTDFIKNPVIN